MKFNEWLLEYGNVIPQWVKDLPQELIDEIEGNGFTCHETYSVVSFSKDYSRMSEYRIKLKQDRLEFSLPNIYDAQDLPAHIDNLNRIMRWDELYKAHLKNQKQ